MKVQVLNDDGSVKLVFDPAASLPKLIATERLAVSNLLCDALHSVNTDAHVIASITGDIRNAIARVETELGAHPAFTWAQTKLGNAAAHLEAYVKGEWEEPKQGLVPAGTAYDQRGVLVQS